MKVTLACQHALPMRHGGAMTHILQIKKHLEKLGLEME